jgi:hypothetical protein
MKRARAAPAAVVLMVAMVEDGRPIGTRNEAALMVWGCAVMACVVSGRTFFPSGVIGISYFSLSLTLLKNNYITPSIA